MDAGPIAPVEADGDDFLFHSLPFGWRGDVRGAHGSAFRRAAKEAHMRPLMDVPDFGGALPDVEAFTESSLPDYAAPMGDDGIVVGEDGGEYVADDGGNYIADDGGDYIADDGEYVGADGRSPAGWRRAVHAAELAAAREREHQEAQRRQREWRQREWRRGGLQAWARPWPTAPGGGETYMRGDDEGYIGADDAAPLAGIRDAIALAPMWVWAAAGALALWWLASDA